MNKLSGGCGCLVLLLIIDVFEYAMWCPKLFFRGWYVECPASKATGIVCTIELWGVYLIGIALLIYILKRLFKK